jgi:hypothetical protein
MTDLVPCLKKQAEVDGEVEGPVLVETADEEHGQLGGQDNEGKAGQD